MSASKKQLAANRQNCKKSTGPKTAEGKAAVSQNHIKHGLYSGNIIVNSRHLKEDRTEFDALVEALTAELHPEGILQNLLVQKIAECFWRRRRLISAETAQINRQLHLLDSDMAFSNALRLSGPKRFISPPDNIDDMISIKSIPKESSSLHLLRYEMRLDRQFINSLRLLAQLKREAGQQHEEKQPPEISQNDDSKPISCNANDDNQLSENLPSGYPREASNRLPAGRGAGGEGGETKNEHSNPTGTSRLPGGIPNNPNSDNELCENLPLDHPCDSIEVAPRHPAPPDRPQRPAPCWVPSHHPSPAGRGAGGEGLLRDDEWPEGAQSASGHIPAGQVTMLSIEPRWVKG